MDKVSISKLAEITNTRPSTIKYYTELGVLPFEQKDRRLIRRYPVKEASEQLKLIAEMREKGEKLADIALKLKQK